MINYNINIDYNIFISAKISGNPLCPTNCHFFYFIWKSAHFFLHLSSKHPPMKQATAHCSLLTAHCSLLTTHGCWR